MRRVMLFSLLIAVAFTLFVGCAYREVKTTEVEPPVVQKQVVVERVEPPAPPAARVEVPGPPPSTGYVWVPGYWDWNGHDYVWISGRYEMTRPETVFVAGHWERTATGWQWIPGHYICSTC